MISLVVGLVPGTADSVVLHCTDHDFEVGIDTVLGSACYPVPRTAPMSIPGRPGSAAGWWVHDPRALSAGPAAKTGSDQLVAAAICYLPRYSMRNLMQAHGTWLKEKQFVGL